MRTTDKELIRDALYSRADVADVAESKNGGTHPRCRAQRVGLASVYQCHNVAKTQRGGHWFCGVCDPIARQEKREKRTAQWQAKFDARFAARARHEKIQAAERLVIDAAKRFLSGVGGAGAELVTAVNALREAEK